MIARVTNRIKWLLYKTHLLSIGKNSHVGVGFDYKGGRYIKIGDNFTAHKNVRIHVQLEQETDKSKESRFPRIIIGNNVTITDNCFISAANRIIIGDGTLLGINTFICDNYHGSNKVNELMIPPIKRKIWSGGPVVVGKNVWIGRNVCIMPGVSIGDGAVIGANAVVTHDVEKNTVVGGVPARRIRYIQEKD